MTSTNIQPFLDSLRDTKRQIARWNFDNGSSSSKYNFSVCDIRDNFIKFLIRLEEVFGKQLPVNFAQAYFFDRHGGELGVSDSPESRELIRDISEEIDKIAIFLDKYVGHVQNNYVIYKDPNGDYYYKGSLVHVKNKTALYYIAFDTIYNNAPTGGEVTFQTILDELKNRGNKNCNDKTIYNQFYKPKKGGHGNGFFRYVKQIKNKTADGRPLIEYMGKSKSVRFNNQKFK